MAPSRPFFEQVQAHYDLSDDFFALFLDPSRTYSCAYFKDEGMSLEEAQRAKIDLSLAKCDLQPGMRLLDVGCGWGGTAMRAAGHYGVRVIGLTLSRNQAAYARQVAQRSGLDVEIRLAGWEEFDEPVDRIVSIGAMEHFRVERYSEFFRRCRELLPRDGRMMVHLIVHGNQETLQPGQDWDQDFLDYAKFIRRVIFPGGQVPPRELVILHAQANGFNLLQTQSLRPHYAKTLDTWAANLAAAREQAVEITSQQVYDDYLYYLTRSAHYFRSGQIDVVQFTLAVK